MRGKTFDRLILRGMVVLWLGILFFLLRKPRVKDWVFVYLFNALTNIVTDKILVAYKILSYPNRVLSKVFDIQILFDSLVYPTFTIFFNQMTFKDKPLTVLYKVFLFTSPLILFEFWAVSRTGMIRWKKWWKWYHTFIFVNVKSLFTRFVIAMVRRRTNKEKRSAALTEGDR